LADAITTYLKDLAWLELNGNKLRADHPAITRVTLALEKNGHGDALDSLEDMEDESNDEEEAEDEKDEDRKTGESTKSSDLDSQLAGTFSNLRI